MTYHCGFGDLRAVGIAPRAPHITCDGCGLVHRIDTTKPPPAWLQNGRAPRGWRKLGNRHYCMVRCGGKPGHAKPPGGAP